MLDTALEHGCDFDKKSFDAIYELPDDLKSIYNQLTQSTKDLLNYKNGNDLFKISQDTIDKITDKYIHISSNWDVSPISGDTSQTTPVKIDSTESELIGSPDDIIRVYRPAKNWIRKILFQNTTISNPIHQTDGNWSHYCKTAVVFVSGGKNYLFAQSSSKYWFISRYEEENNIVY
ncbi:hypothetical protein [Chryseobacterium sp. ON_d1]|uniref:hypothetical protein n=1 Tax=Chryseobacterium sp. ON_d1 TaxID=2583211 RepID=UPI00115735B6|nr:hypothetical protein [Chryseobacterium sp. ON_d1]GEJ43579.1 hypothetical protein CRS_01870 [Chryseobacterium sp. ON_d1]